MKNHILIVLFTISVSAQIKGVVRDSIKLTPISYAALVIENTSIGTNCDEFGRFQLDTSKPEQKIVISCLGYKTKVVVTASFMDVLLEPLDTTIEEVEISTPKKNSEIIVGQYKKTDISFSNNGASGIWAKHIAFTDDIKNHPFIKTIEFTTQSSVKNAKLKLRFLNTNENGLPGVDLVFDEIIITVKKGKNKNKISLDQYGIKIPENGIFIGFETLTIKENKYDFVYTNEGSSKKIRGERYEPSIKGHFAKETNVWYITSQNKVKFNNIHFKDSKPVELGVALTLTN